MRRHAKAIVVISALLLTLAPGATVAGAVAPSVTVDNAENVDYTTADVKGTVDPGDLESFYHFEASTAADFSTDLAFTGSGSLPAGGGSQPVGPAEFTGLKPGATYHLRLVAANNDGSAEALAASTFTTEALPLPTVTIDPVTAITDDGAHLSGTINPNAPAGNPAAAKVKWHFECTPACPSVELDGIFPIENPVLPADNVDHTVEADADGLDPNTSYEVRLVATNAGGQQSASDETSFQTSAPAPLVQPLPPAVIDNDSAWIGAYVNPQNSPTTYYIEFSSDPSFATSTKVPASEDAAAGAGNSLAFVNHHADGLAPNTTYYYRVVATGAGTTVGESESFTTRALPFSSEPGLPDRRVYERVSPVDKKGAELLVGPSAQGNQLLGYGLEASANGDAIAYASVTSFAGDGAGALSQYLAKRGPTDWITKGLTPRMDPVPVIANNAGFTWFSKDLNLSLVNTAAALNRGDLEGGTRNLYLRNNVDDSYQAITDNSKPQGTLLSARGVSGDEQHIVFQLENPGGSPPRLYQYGRNGVYREVGVLNGTSVEADLGNAFGQFVFPGQNPISNDGSRVYFNTPGPVGGRSIYLREFGSPPTTRLINANGRFQLASADGSVAFFIPESVSSVDSTLYRWDADAPSGSELTDIGLGDPAGKPGVLGTAGASDDAKVVYFVATGKLTSDAIAGAPNLYLWLENGGLSLVATLDEADTDVWSSHMFSADVTTGMFREARVSSDGRLIAFSSRRSLTAYDTDGTNQIYLYDNEHDRLTCVSCGIFAAKPAASSWLRSAGRDGTAYGASLRLPRNLAENGTYVLFESRDALVPEDSNGVLDVYRWMDGELRLISSGENDTPSRFIDASESGEDLFFATRQRLVASDLDTAYDIYDARVDGRPEPALRAPCVADECQGTPGEPPAFQTPSSAAFQGQGNTSARPRCTKGKVRRQGACVRKRKRQRAEQKRKGRNQTTRVSNDRRNG